jgi:hypothetical protein
MVECFSTEYKGRKIKPLESETLSKENVYSLQAEVL